jgi:CRISPR-associated Cas5-like protein
MKVIKVDLEVPFWCSFSEYGTVNIRSTYPFPPPTTIFGLIQNSLQKPALHDIEKNKRKGIANQYLDGYSNLDFAIIIREKGEKIDDYLNIHKGSREIESFESSLKEDLEAKLAELDLDENDKKTIKKELNKLKRKYIADYIIKVHNNQKLPEKDEKVILSLIKLIEEVGAGEILIYIQNFWKSFKTGNNAYNLNKKWISTQINRQRLINPKYTLFISSNDFDGEYSLENIYENLKTPKRLLYLGESDDIINLDNIEMKETMASTTSSKIDSVIPGVFTNCQLVKIPNKLKNDFPNENGHNIICSIPEGELDTTIPCLKIEGEHIVFLQSFGEK